MTTGYSNYHVELKNEVYVTDAGISYPTTAVVKLYDEKGEEAGREFFGVADVEHIYSMIRSGKSVNLDNSYIRAFSLSEYRRQNGIEKKEPVHINGLSAKNAFFEAQNTNDFSYVSLPDGDTSFEGSHFARGKVSFTGSVFHKGIVNFSNCLFRDGNIEFTGSVFGEGDFLFKNSVVKDGIKDFQDIQFGKGEVSFANTEFNSGNSCL